MNSEEEEGKKYVKSRNIGFGCKPSIEIVALNYRYGHESIAYSTKKNALKHKTGASKCRNIGFGYQ